MPVLTSALFSSLLLPFSLAAEPARLITPGTFHGDEMPLPTGHDRWLGLYEDEAGGLAWKYVAPAFRPAEDPVLDEPGQQTGVEVAVPGEQPMMMVRGVPGLSPGVVTHATAPHQPLLPGSTVKIDDNFKLVATSPNGTSYHLELVGPGGLTQVLADYDELVSDAMPALVLAADLDHDGRPDLIMDLTNHYNLSRLTLLLSSQAGPGALVAPAAALQTTGC